MSQQIIKLNGLSSEEQQLVNEIMTLIDNNKKDDLLEIQQWIDRCKADVILSTPHFDGHDINGWVDECESWLIKTTETEGIKVNINSICKFREIIRDWVEDKYYKYVI